jgi:hypothetical protein
MASSKGSVLLGSQLPGGISRSITEEERTKIEEIA